MPRLAVAGFTAVGVACSYDVGIIYRAWPVWLNGTSPFSAMRSTEQPELFMSDSLVS